MGLDAKINPKVKGAIARLGRPALLQEYATTYDFVNNARSADPTRASSITITPVLDLRRSLSDDLTDATAYCLMAASGAPFVPTTACFLTVDGKRWKVVEVVTHSAGETPAAYEMRLASV